MILGFPPAVKNGLEVMREIGKERGYFGKIRKNRE
jgi:hypothetical protein